MKKVQLSIYLDPEIFASLKAYATRLSKPKFVRSSSSLFRTNTILHSSKEKPDRSTQAHILVRLESGAAEAPHAAAISTSDGIARRAPEALGIDGGRVSEALNGMWS
jgi:hypothetical protein